MTRALEAAAGCLSIITSLLAKWIIKEDYQSPPSSFSLDFIFRTSLQLILPIFFYHVLTTYTSASLYAYLFYTFCIGITLFTDAYALLISTYVTSWIIPLGLMSSYYGWISVSITESLIGSIGALLLLKSVSYVASKLMKKESMGSGDIHLIATIGAWTGLLGCWTSILVGSILGSLYGVIQIMLGKDKDSLLLPFGTFLSIGTLFFIIFQSRITSFFIS